MSKEKKEKSELKDSVSLSYDYLSGSENEANIEVLAGYDRAASQFFINKSQILGLFCIIISCLSGFIFYREFAGVLFLFAGFTLHLTLIVVKHQVFFSKVLAVGKNFVQEVLQSAKTAFTGQDFDEELPLYSILLPVFKESKEVIEQLFLALERLNYPEDKKQILLLIEQYDEETLAIVQKINTDLPYQMIIVPDFSPRTKAKACNYALQFVRGEFVVIFDADDIPEANQLLSVLEKFKRSKDCKLACVQAKLNYYNANENLLTKLFSLEYSILFEKILPNLAGIQAPLPLGGTSNHFKTRVLKELKGWDIYNLTEDAEIGMRLSYYGYNSDVVDSYTLEEAPVSIYAWLKQRSRWLKGFIQTYCLYSQNKYNLKKKVGLKKHFLSLDFMLGLSTLSLLMTPLMLITGFSMTGISQILPSWLYSSLNILSCSGFLIWLMSTFLQSYITIKNSPFLSKNSKLDKMIAILSFPFYFSLHIFAAFYAVIDLIIRPFYWNKTAHGVTQKKKLDYLTDYFRKDNDKAKKNE